MYATHKTPHFDQKAHKTRSTKTSTKKHTKTRSTNTSTKKHPKTKSTQKDHHKKPPHISRSKLYIQDIIGKSSRLTPKVSEACKRSAFGSRSSFSSETPKEKAISCKGGLRLGKTGKYVYASVPQFKRSVHRPKGYISFTWKKVYDKNSKKTDKKPFDLKEYFKKKKQGIIPDSSYKKLYHYLIS